MDADKPTFSTIRSQDDRNEARSVYAADFEMARARNAASRARIIAENDDLNRIQPGVTETARARWLGEGGRPADDREGALPSIYPEPTRP